MNAELKTRPRSLNDGNSDPLLPVRKQLNHNAPFRCPDAFYFVTICAKQRGSSVLTDTAEPILNAARHRQLTGKWFLSLFLIMPDHVHMLVHVPPSDKLSSVICDFKRYLMTEHGLAFQYGYFDTRIRDAEHYDEKWKYIVRNPVVRGLASTPREWPHVIAFDRRTGQERPHR